MKKWLTAGFLLLGLLILGQVQDTSHLAIDIPSMTIQPDDLSPKH